MIKKILLSLLIAITFLWSIGLIIFGYSINHPSTDHKQKTDAIIALTGGRNRISEAVKLLNNGLSDHLFISGVASGISLRDIMHTQKLHTLSDSIELGHEAIDTIGNAYETSLWAKQHHITSLRLVTSNYHINRAMIEFKHFMPQMNIIAHPVYSEHLEKKWWTSWQTFSLICKEYNKLVYAFMKYQLNL